MSHPNEYRVSEPAPGEHCHGDENKNVLVSSSDEAAVERDHMGDNFILSDV